MRATTHEVVLPGGRLVLPLTFATLRAVSSVTAVPGHPELGAFDPAKVILGAQYPALVTMLEVLHAAAGKDSPGLDKLFSWGTQKEIQEALIHLCAVLLNAMGPDKPEAAPPKN